MIDFRCTNCGKLLRTGPETAGKRAKCPDCGTLLTIPLPAGAGPAPAMPGGALPAGGPPPARPPQGPAVNPFQSPQAPLGAFPPAGSIAPSTLDMNDLFITTWGVFKANLGMAIALPLVINLIMLVAAMIILAIVGLVWSQSVALGFLFYLLALAALTALSAALGAGLLKALLKLARGQPVAFGELFAFGPELVPFILTHLLYSAVVFVGTLCCIVPGYILAVMFSQSLFLVLDRNMGVLDSFNRSKELTNGNKVTIFLTWFIASLVAPFAIILTCGIGFFFVPPFLALLACVVHLRLTSQPIAVPVQ